MGIARVTPTQVVTASVETLGLDSAIADFGAPEVLAAAVRRAASFLCPVSPRLLSRVVEESMFGLLDDDPRDAELGSPVRAMLEDLVAYGDLVELPIDDEDRGISHRMVFLGQPTYVRLSETVCLVVGVLAEGLELLDDDLADGISYDAHVRRLELPGGDEAALLRSAGLRELSAEQWLEHPRMCAPDVLLSEYELRLTSAGPSGTIVGCRIIDPDEPVTYYRGRWRAPTTRDSGRYVARRPLEFGPDAWCYAEVQNGEVVKILDLPAHHRTDRACDEAWRLQAAIDCLAGNPQKVRVVHRAGAREPLLHLLSPVPSWAQRRLDSIGRPLPRERGSLISYAIAEEQLADELSFLAQTMWIELERRG